MICLTVKEAATSSLPMTLLGMANVSKIWEIIESHCRYTMCDIAKAVGISLPRVHFILKRMMKIQKVLLNKKYNIFI